MNQVDRLMRRHAARHERGQVLAIVAGGMFVIIAMVGLVIDGGYAWGRQRETQNGADSTAKAGAVVILQWLDGETKTAGDVGCAVERVATETNVDREDVQFTSFDGSPLGIPVPGCGSAALMPTDAQGVKAITTQEFSPFIMSAFGFGNLTARSDATAVVGPLVGTSAVLPITFPQTFSLCDASGDVYTIRNWDQENDPGGPPATTGVWDPYEVLPTSITPDASNLAIIPLCSIEPGSVGWLEFNCGNLSETITNPCDTFFTIPDWIQTQTGNVNSLEGDLALYHGDQPGVYEPETNPADANPDRKVTFPIHRTTCEDDPGVSDTDGDGNVDTLNPCPAGEWTAGEGDNLFYGVDFWVGFVLDEAHVQGSDVECQQPSGQPQLDSPTGYVGCLKGWFVSRIGQPDEVSIGDVDPGDTEDLGVTLIN